MQLARIGPVTCRAGPAVKLQPLDGRYPPLQTQRFLHVLWSSRPERNESTVLRLDMWAQGLHFNELHDSDRELPQAFL